MHENRLTHLDAHSEVAMVDVSAKPIQHREAIASGTIFLGSKTLDLIQSDAIAKGNVLATARLAGIMGAKKTGELIPLCHSLALRHCEIQFDFPPTRDRILLRSKATVQAQTGVEMEALTAVTIAALTIYDMCKSVDKTMRISEIQLISKIKR